MQPDVQALAYTTAQGLKKSSNLVRFGAVETFKSVLNVVERCGGMDHSHEESRVEVFHSRYNRATASFDPETAGGHGIRGMKIQVGRTQTAT